MSTEKNDWINLGDLPSDIQTPFPFMFIKDNQIIIINNTENIYSYSGEYGDDENKWNNISKQIKLINDYQIISIPSVNSNSNSNYFYLLTQKLHKKVTNKMMMNNIQQKQTINNRDHAAFGLIYIPLKNEFLLIGGNGSYGGCSRKIMKYELNDNMNNSWIELKTWAPGNGIAHFGYILTNNQQYIIMLGGVKHRGGGMGPDFQLFHDKIWILNLQEMSIKESNVKCPKKGIMKAMITRKDDDMLINGFMRSIDDVIDIPDDIRNNIQLFYGNSDELHLFIGGTELDDDHQAHWTESNISHWKISVDDIVN